MATLTGLPNVASDYLYGPNDSDQEDHDMRNQEVYRALFTGFADWGRQVLLTQWDGPDYHLDVTSKDTVDGKAQRVLSQNTLFGHRINNAEYGIVGAPTLDAFTTGSVLFVGASKVLSQDNANFFWDDTNNRLGIGTSAPAQKIHVVGNGQVSTFLGVGGAPDTTHALLVTGLAEVTSRMGVGAAADATITLLVTGTLKSTGDFTVGATKYVVTASSGATSQAGSQTFVGTALRILGDFSNGTVPNRLTFQSSTANGNTFIGAIPNGSATQAAWTAFNAADSGNASAISMQATATEVKLVSAVTGGGSLQPMTFYYNTTKVMEIGNNTWSVFGVTPVVQQTSPGQATASIPSAGADATYGNTERDMLNDFVTVLTELQADHNTIVTRLTALGLIA